MATPEQNVTAYVWSVPPLFPLNFNQTFSNRSVTTAKVELWVRGQINFWENGGSIEAGLEPSDNIWSELCDVMCLNSTDVFSFCVKSSAGFQFCSSGRRRSGRPP